MYKFICFILAFFPIFTGLSSPAFSQDYPSRPIKLVVPLPPGGGTDLMGRLTAQILGNRLSQGVVVENKAGGGSIIGVDNVAKTRRVYIAMDSI